MGRFLLRRLLTAVPTLFGICLITFALIHLAPGDPTAGGAGTPGGNRRRQDVAAERRLFFLDLPAFINPSPRGLGARAERLLAPFRTASPVGDEAAAALRRCGTACLNPMTDLRARLPAPRRADLERSLAALRQDHPRLAPEARSLTGWLTLANSQVSLLATRQVADRLGRDAGAVGDLTSLGLAALPAAMEVMLDGDETQRRAANEVIGALTRLQAPARGPRADPDRQRAFWSEWWFQHRRDHATFTPWQRIHGVLTETQFGKWLARIVTFRFGHSTHDGRPVSEKLKEALPVTLLLSFLSMALAYLIAVPIGVHAAVRQGSLVERATTVALFVLYSLPSFWVAMVLILLLGGVGFLDWFPIYGLSGPGLEDATGWTWLADRIHHLVLPVVCLTYGSLAVISRYQRSAMLEVIRQDFIRTARAKGLDERAVIFRHALRNALLPTITLLGLQLPYLISGSVVIERIFNIPGMGLMTFQAFLNRDYPVIMAVSVLSAILTLGGLILSDLFYAVVDPRISLGGRS